MNNATKLTNVFSARRVGVLALLLLMGLTVAAPGVQAAQVVPTVRLGYLGAPDEVMANGALMAIDEINGTGGVVGPNGAAYQLELVTLAEPLTADMLPQALEALVAQNVAALLGPETGGALTADNIDLLVSSGLAVLTGATVDNLTSIDSANVIFRARAPERVYSYALATYLLDDLGLKTFVLVQTDVASTEALLDFNNILGQRGVEPLDTIQLADASTLLEEATPLLDLEPDVVVMWGPPADAATLLALLRNGGWTGQFAYRHTAEAAEMGLIGDALGAGVLGVDSWSYASPADSSRIFATEYVQTFGHIPGALAVAGYDAVWYLRSTIRDQGTMPAQILTGLQSFPSADLVGGTLRPADFTDGDLIRIAMVYRLNSGGGAQVVAVFDELARVPLPAAQ